MPAPTPAEAWIACALCAASLPLCLYPLSALRLGKSLLLHAPTRTWNATMTTLWTVTLISHMALIWYTVTAATEKTCRDGSPSDFGWTVGPPACKRRMLTSVINILEYMTAPFYPMYILSTYVRLRPTKSTRVKNQLKVLVAVVGLLLGSFTAILMFSSAVEFLFVSSLDPAFQRMAQLGDYLYHRVFDLWALSLILCATCSLVCAIRIIPFLDLRHAKQSTTNATSSVPFSRFRTLATAHLSNTSSASKSLLPTLSGSHLGQHASSSSSSASQHMSALGGESPITPTPAAPAASTTSSDGRARAVQTCVRQLKMLLLVIALVLAGDVILVLVITLPDVLFTVLGWLSCRVVSVSLFAAVNLIRKTVIAKRKVPNPAMGSLATDWQGATTRKMG